MGGYPIGVHPTDGYHIGGHPTGELPIGGLPIGGHPIGGHPTGGYPRGGYPISVADRCAFSFPSFFLTTFASACNCHAGVAHRCSIASPAQPLLYFSFSFS